MSTATVIGAPSILQLVGDAWTQRHLEAGKGQFDDRSRTWSPSHQGQALEAHGEMERLTHEVGQDVALAAFQHASNFGLWKYVMARQNSLYALPKDLQTRLACMMVGSFFCGLEELQLQGDHPLTPFQALSLRDGRGWNHWDRRINGANRFAQALLIDRVRMPSFVNEARGLSVSAASDDPSAGSFSSASLARFRLVLQRHEGGDTEGGLTLSLSDLTNLLGKVPMKRLAEFAVVRLEGRHTAKLFPGFSLGENSNLTAGIVWREIVRVLTD